MATKPKSKPNASNAAPVSFLPSIATPILKGVASSAFGNMSNTAPPSAAKAPPPGSSQPTRHNRPIFPKQANPSPVVFGSGTAAVSLNTGTFARNNPGTTSVAGGGPGVTLSATAFPQEYWRNVEVLETMCRGICIDAVQDMKKIRFGGKTPPAVMGVLLALNEVKDGERLIGKGWQVYIHSSVRGSPPDKRSQAILPAKLQARLDDATIDHHFMSMCAEIGLLSNFLGDNPSALQADGALKLCGEPVYMMTYVAGLFPPKQGKAPKDGTGYYLVPCSHSVKNCGNRTNHLGKHGCQDVLRLLGVQEIGRGVPSEQDPAVLAEQVARENRTAT